MLLLFVCLFVCLFVVVDVVAVAVVAAAVVDVVVAQYERLFFSLSPNLLNSCPIES